MHRILHWLFGLVPTMSDNIAAVRLTERLPVGTKLYTSPPGTLALLREALAFVAGYQTVMHFGCEASPESEAKAKELAERIDAALKEAGNE